MTAVTVAGLFTVLVPWRRVFHLQPLIFIATYFKKSKDIDWDDARNMPAVLAAVIMPTFSNLHGTY